MKNKKTLIIILVALVLFLAGGFVRLKNLNNQKQLLIEEEERKNLEKEAQQIFSKILEDVSRNGVVGKNMVVA